MTAVSTLDPCKTVEKISTIQIALHNFFDMGAKVTASPFKTIFIDLLQGFKVVFNAAILNVGALWENFVVAERLKKRSYTGIYGTFHFWRTYDGKEIDYVEERDGGLFGFECKWSSKKQDKPPRKWLEAYKGATFTLVTPDNYLDIVG